MNEIEELYAEQDRLYSEFSKKRKELIERVLPVGMQVSWMFAAKHLQFGKVVRHGYGDDLEVKNDATGKTRWITARYLTPHSR